MGALPCRTIKTLAPSPQYDEYDSKGAVTRSHFLTEGSAVTTATQARIFYSRVYKDSRHPQTQLSIFICLHRLCEVWNIVFHKIHLHQQRSWLPTETRILTPVSPDDMPTAIIVLLSLGGLILLIGFACLVNIAVNKKEGSLPY